MFGWLAIFDLEKDQTLKYVRVLKYKIKSVVFTRNNQSAYIADWEGNIALIKWKQNSSSADDFSTQVLTQVGNKITVAICLTKDEKNLLVGSRGLVSMINTKTSKLIIRFKLTTFVKGIELINEGKQALIAEENGNLTIVDLETLEITQSRKNVGKGKKLMKITLI